MKYNTKDFTWGYELEYGDISRNVIIPEHLGKWEYCETDIVNEIPPYRGIACDPAGVNPPVGGEINTKPTKTWQDQVDRVFEILDIFKKLGQTPTSSCVNHGHLHVFVPGLKDDIESLKRLVKYIKENQHITIDKCYQYSVHQDMSTVKTAKTYLKWDGGRPMPDYMCDNIIKLANNFNDFIRLQCAGKDGVSMGRPFRRAINIYNMKHIGTIEFRCFRSSPHRKEVEDSFRFAEKFLDAALNDGPPVEEILSEYNYSFPQMIYNNELYSGWEKTKYPNVQGNKVREYHDIQN